MPARHAPAGLTAVVLFSACLAAAPAPAQQQEPVTTHSAVLKPDSLSDGDLQVLLFRHGYPPGLVDGASGEMTREALSAFQEDNGIQPTGRLDTETAEVLIQGQPATFIDYAITPEDVAGPFGFEFANGPQKLKVLPPFRSISPLHALADQFKITRDYLRQLNPKAEWKPGEVIRVPNLN